MNSKASMEVAEFEKFLFIEMPLNLAGGELLSAGWRAAGIGKYLWNGTGKLLEAMPLPKSVESSFFEGTTYSTKVLGQIKLGDFHAFPESVKAFESSGTISTIKGGDGVVRQILRIPGQYGNKSGFFEFIKEPNGLINHRLFNIKP